MTWWQNFFYGSSEEEKVDPLIAEFEEDGFSYNEVDDRWQRVWSTTTKAGRKTVLEVRKKVEDEWKYIVCDDNGDVFYEGKLNG